jgi:pre-mRNA-splicing factor ATP-dependent RNA helicase DHX38/PRP16
MFVITRTYILILFFLFIVPNLPASRDHARTRVEETPTHTGGLSESARQKLEERRKNRDKQRGIYGLLFMTNPCLLTSSLVSPVILQRVLLCLMKKTMPSAGLGDFQHRLNRDRDQGWGGRRDYERP